MVVWEESEGKGEKHDYFPCTSFQKIHQASAMSEEIPLEFIARLPKIELHAHLNGSLKAESVLELGRKLYGANTQDFIDLTRRFISYDGLNLQECFKRFQFIHDLTATVNGLRLATQMVIRDFAADNVVYLELRTTPKSNENMTKHLYLMTVLEAIQTADEVVSGKIKVKLLPSIDRSKPIAEAIEMLDIVLKLRQNSQKVSQLISGIDLSGNPSYGTFQQVKSVLEKARQNKLKLALHCAEIDNPKEIEEMLLFGMDRCGHGTFLNTAQIAELSKRNIAIECCLTSNVKTATVLSYDDHHFKRIIHHHNLDDKFGISVLCTDDCGVFDTTLTNELDIAARSFELDKEDLLRLQLNAVEHAFTNEKEKKELKKKILDYSNERLIQI